jgi:hypothetical protein
LIRERAEVEVETVPIDPAHEVHQPGLQTAAGHPRDHMENPDWFGLATHGSHKVLRRVERQGGPALA